MTRICLVVPHEKQPIAELRHFLTAENADIYVFPEMFLNTEVLPKALEIIRELQRFVITGYREYQMEDITELYFITKGEKR